jgi:hypothetical protein
MREVRNFTSFAYIFLRPLQTVPHRTPRLRPRFKLYLNYHVARTGTKPILSSKLETAPRFFNHSTTRPRAATMPAFLLIIGLMCLPLIVGTCFTIAGFKAYRKRRLLVTDVERAQHGIELQDLEPGANKPHPHLQNMIPLPIAQPLPRPRADIKGIGGGFVQYFRPSSTPARKASRKSHARELESGFEIADLYSRLGWLWTKGEDSINHLASQPSTAIDTSVPSSPRIYTGTNYGRYNSTEATTEVGESFVLARYGHADDRAAEAWKKIARRESLVGGRKVGFEDVDRGREGMPVVLESAFIVGEGSDEERGSLDSGRRHFEGKEEGDELDEVRGEEGGVERQRIVEGEKAEEKTQNTHSLDVQQAIKAAIEGLLEHGDTDEIDHINNHSSPRRLSRSTNGSDKGTLPTVDNMPSRTSSMRDNPTAPSKVSTMYVGPMSMPKNPGPERKDSASKPKLARHSESVESL